MEIEKIILHTTREIYNVHEKLSIAAIFIFCYKKGSKQFAELLYTNNYRKLIKNLNEKYLDYDIIFDVNFDNVNVNNSFNKTIKEVQRKYDSDGFYKALFNKDPFALVINNIVNYNFDKVEMKKFTENAIKQLELDL